MFVPKAARYDTSSFRLADSFNHHLHTSYNLDPRAEGMSKIGQDISVKLC